MAEIWRGFLVTWQTVRRDRGALLLFFAAGIIYSFFYPLPYEAEQVERTPVAVVDEDGSALSRQLGRYLMASPELVVHKFSDQAAAKAALQAGDLQGIVVLPRGLYRQVLRQQPAVVTVLGNGAYLLAAQHVLGAVATVTGAVSAGLEIRQRELGGAPTVQAMATRSPFVLTLVPLFNPQEGYASYIVPAVSILIIQQTLLLGIGLLAGTWREQGLPREASTGLATYVGVWLAFASISLLMQAYYLGFVFWWQDFPRHGDFWPLLVFCPLFALTTSALGLLIGSALAEREQALQLLLFISLPALFLVGVSWPVEAFPAPLRVLSWLLPSTPGIWGFMKLVPMGAALVEVQQHCLHLLLLAGSYFLLGWWAWKRRICLAAYRFSAMNRRG
ncbi:MAG: ABC transporter permease [Pedobacter sp.]|nr:ABC transporter permease [Pedobacter sp.]